MVSVRIERVIATVVLLLCATSCREIPTTVRVEPGPFFRLHGSGRLAHFTVFAPRRGEDIAFPDSDVATVAWRIDSAGGYFQGQHVEGLTIRYGSAPAEYKQAVPDGHQPPASLVSGRVYAFIAETSDAPIASGYFYVTDAGPIQIRVPDLCVGMLGGRKERVSCHSDTAVPYTEPTDIESFARQNQIQ